MSPLSLAPRQPAIGLCTLVMLGCMLAASSAARAESVRWATGTELEQQLAAPLSVSWQGTPLSRALGTLAQTQRVAIVRDRRVNPDQEITLAIEREPLGQALTHLADELKAGYCQLGPVAYLGPRETAQRLRTVAAMREDEARALPAELSQKFLLLRTWHWNMLAEPRALVADLAAEAGVEIVNPQRLPHDLWPETDLPLLSWVDRLSLVAAQFDLTFRFLEGGRRVELVDFPEEARATRSYAGGRSARALARRWSRDLPGAKIDVAGEEVRVEATLEQHEQIEQRLAGKPTQKRTVTRGQEVYQLAVEKTALDKLVDEVARRLGLEVRWDRDATTAVGIAADQLVTVRVEQVNLDQLLDAVFAGTGLTYSRRGKTITVRAQ